MARDTAASRLAKRSVLFNLFRLMRPGQWIKNGFILAPLIFTGEFLNLAAIEKVLLAVLFFCIASSATYIINDIVDVKRDRKHPIKAKKRPLAAGQVKVSQAVALLIGLYAILGLGFLLLPKVMLVIMGYLILNLAYTFILKQQPVIDIFCIAIGFVFRVYAGAVALAVPVSSWMFITTLCLALYLAAMKRRQELIQRGKQSREVLKEYTIEIVDRYAQTAAVSAVLFYGLFVMTSRPGLVITIPIVLYGLFRYWFVVETVEDGESPADVLFRDWQLLLTVLIWVVACLGLLWPK